MFPYPARTVFSSLLSFVVVLFPRVVAFVDIDIGLGPGAGAFICSLLK